MTTNTTTTTSPTKQLRPEVELGIVITKITLWLITIYFVIMLIFDVSAFIKVLNRGSGTNNSSNSPRISRQSQRFTNKFSPNMRRMWMPLFLLAMTSLFGLIDVVWGVASLEPWTDSYACNTFNSFLPFFWVMTQFFGFLILFERASAVGVLEKNRRFTLFRRAILVMTFGVPGFAILTIFFWYGHIVPESSSCIMVGDFKMDWSMVCIDCLLSAAYIVLFVVPVRHHMKAMQNSKDTISSQRLHRVAVKNLILSTTTIAITTADMYINAYGNTASANNDETADVWELIALALAYVDLLLISIIYHIMISTWIPVWLGNLIQDQCHYGICTSFCCCCSGSSNNQGGITSFVSDGGSTSPTHYSTRMQIAPVSSSIGDPSAISVTARDANT
jgi:hypothetical protein